MQNEGTKGLGHTGYSKYSPEDAPVINNGGNSEEQDGIVSTSSEKNFYGRPNSSLQK